MYTYHPQDCDGLDLGGAKRKHCIQNFDQLLDGTEAYAYYTRQSMVSIQFIEPCPRHP